MNVGRQPAARKSRTWVASTFLSLDIRSVDPTSAAAAGLLGVTGILSLLLVTSQQLASIAAVIAWVAALSLLRVIPLESALITTTAVVLAIGTPYATLERFTVSLAAILALAMMFLSLRGTVADWRLTFLRTTICLLLVLAGIFLVLSNPSTGTAGAALFAVLLAGCILTQLTPVWPLTTGLTCLGCCGIFLALGWIEIANQVGGAALFSLLAASVLLLAENGRG